MGRAVPMSWPSVACSNPSVGLGMEHTSALCSSPPWGPRWVPAPLLAQGAACLCPSGRSWHCKAGVFGVWGQGWGLRPPTLPDPMISVCPQRLFEWLDTAELRMAEEFLVGGDLDLVQQQLAELKVGCAAGWGPEPWGQAGGQWRG